MSEKVVEESEEKRCILCNRSYEHYYDMFGRTCLTHLYEQLSIPNSRYISNKEAHFCNTIALRNLKFFLSKKKKDALMQNYVELDYVKKMNLDSLKDVKSKLEENIKAIGPSRKRKIFDFSSFDPREFSLNDFYKIYDDYTDFRKSLDNYINTEEDDENKDKYLDESLLNGFSAIFDLGKITLPLHYAVFYGLQEMFWKTVVVGGIFADMNLSAYLMNLSLDNSGEYKEEGNNLIIDDEL